MKFGAQGARPGTIVERSQSRNQEAGDDEDHDWPGRERRIKLRAGVERCITKALKNALPLDKNSGFARDGAISAPQIDLSVEISLCKLQGLNFETREEEDTIAVWRNELVGSLVVNAGWRQETLSALPDEGDLLQGVGEAFLVVPEGKFPRDMTREEVFAIWEEVNKAEVKEIKGLYEFGCFQRYPRARAHNIIDARWVNTWNMIEGSVGCKCRFIVRGFKDRFQDFDAYVGTSSRSGQRVVNATVVENKGFICFGFDVSQSFAKGLAFEEFRKFTGIERRAVQFDVPSADLGCLKQIKRV